MGRGSTGTGSIFTRSISVVYGDSFPACRNLYEIFHGTQDDKRNKKRTISQAYEAISLGNVPAAVKYIQLWFMCFLIGMAQLWFIGELYIFSRIFLWFSKHKIHTKLIGLSQKCCKDSKSISVMLLVFGIIFVFLCKTVDWFCSANYTILGLLLCTRGQITAGELVLCMLLSMSMVGSLAALETFSNILKEMQMSIEALQEYLELPELPEPTGRAEIKGFNVELNHVYFSYTGSVEDEVLHDVNLQIPEGKFVTQDNFLFRCSLMENIRLGNPKATDQQVKEAAKAAQCEEFIKKLKGYDTPVGEAGKRLSGGEKQRIAIARMMLKNAPILPLHTDLRP